MTPEEKAKLVMEEITAVCAKYSVRGIFIFSVEYLQLSFTNFPSNLEVLGAIQTLEIKHRLQTINMINQGIPMQAGGDSDRSDKNFKGDILKLHKSEDAKSIRQCTEESSDGPSDDTSSSDTSGHSSETEDDRT